MDEEGQRLLSSAERRLVCTEPPRLSHLSLVEIPLNSLVCIPPLVQLQHRRLAVRLGDSIRVSCHASGYPRPQVGTLRSNRRKLCPPGSLALTSCLCVQVTWRKASPAKSVLAPRALLQELDAGEEPRGREEDAPGRGGVLLQKSEGERFDPDTGSGMLFLNNVTVAHAGFYECEAWNAGGMARVTFQLAINSSSSSSSSIWASWSHWSLPYSPAWPRRRGRGPALGSEVSREPLYALGSMAFSSLGAATQTAIAAGISLLALTALLLLAMIYARQHQREKESAGAVQVCAAVQRSNTSTADGVAAQPQGALTDSGPEHFSSKTSQWQQLHVWMRVRRVI